MHRDCLSMPIVLALALLVPACDAGAPSEAFFMPAGALTVYDRSAQAFQRTPEVLGGAALTRHRAGATAFGTTFAAATGLGPTFNHTSCTGCHVAAGRGLAVVGPELGASPMLVRVSLAPALAGRAPPEVPGGPIPVPDLGLQLQDHAVAGAAIEASVRLAWDDVPGTYGDGQAYTLRRPRVTITRPDGTPLGAGVLTSLRIAAPVFGLGLLEAIPAADLEARADPDDRDGDGISGRANHVWDPAHGRAALGRFGWKANTASLAAQVAAAYVNDMGVTNPVFPAADAPPELDPATLAVNTFFVATLGAPEPWPGESAAERAAVAHGESVFRAFRCDGCHVETLATGAAGTIGEMLGGQTIHPYTDLLLHDLGEALGDSRPDFEATGTEWRTAPLWGLGLTQTVLPGAGFLHDGRARDAAEAILWHGGEAEAAREVFRLAPAADRAALLAFLASR